MLFVWLVIDWAENTRRSWSFSYVFILACEDTLHLVVTTHVNSSSFRHIFDVVATSVILMFECIDPAVRVSVTLTGLPLLLCV